MGHNNQVLKSLVLSLAFIAGNVFCEVMHLETGTHYTFKPNVNIPPGEKMETILWKYKSDKVVEYEFVNNEWIPSWYRFKDRGNLNPDNGEFTLRNLQKTDGGLYESEIQVNKKLQYSTHDVRVIDAVPKPSVTCDANSTTVTLKCSVDSSVQVNFKWSGPNGFTDSEATIIVPNDDTTPNQKLIYICSVDNELKKGKSTDFYLSTCKKESSDSGSGVIIGIVVSILVLIIVAGLVAFVMKKKKRYMPVETINVTTINQNDDNACAGDPKTQNDSSNNVTADTHEVEKESGGVQNGPGLDKANGAQADEPMTQDDSSNDITVDTNEEKESGGVQNGPILDKANGAQADETKPEMPGGLQQSNTSDVTDENNGRDGDAQPDGDDRVESDRADTDIVGNGVDESIEEL